jgi:Uma2 family endonuclease
MATTEAKPRLMTTDDLLAMPDDGVERWLYFGQLREKRDTEMTKRNRFHSSIMALVSAALVEWSKKQPSPRGQVLCGEAGVILSHEPDLTVGVDVAYVPADVLTRQTDETTLIDGVPTLLVEILSPSDTQEEIDEKLDGYRRAGVPLVWVIDPHDRTVLVYRPGQQPELCNQTQELTAGPHLPGFRVPVADLFS